MAEVQIVEEWVPTKSDNFPIYHRTWKAVGEVIATVAFVHGFGEHCARYDHVFTAFAHEGIEVHSCDQRGYGQTGKKSKTLGRTLGYKVVISDIDELITRAHRPNVPLFLYGHSMGGAIALTYAAIGPQRHELKGLIVSSPLLKTQAAPPSFLISAVQTISTMLPNLTVKAKLDEKYISRDPKVVEDYKNDPLVHNTITLLALGDMIMAGKLLISSRYAELPEDLPYLLVHGDQDHITVFEASKEFHEKTSHVRDRTFKNMEGFYHETHNDFGKEEVIQLYITWIKEHLDGNGAGTKNAMARL